MNMLAPLDFASTYNQMLLRKADVLSKWRKEIEKAVRMSNQNSYENVYLRVMSDINIMVWENAGSFAIIDPQYFPLKKVLFLWICGGAQESLYELEKDVAEWGKCNGFAAMTIIGRRGFTKRLPSHGWKQPVVYFEKEI